MALHLLENIENFKDNELKAFEIEDHRICAVKVNGVIKAFKNRCAHQNMPLHTGFIKDNWVVCSFHGWLFDMDSGDCGVNPSCKLPIYKVVEKENKVYVEIP